MTDPTNDTEQVAESHGYNRIAEALANALSGEWWIESEVDAVGRAYHGDPRNTDPKDVVAVEIRTDYEAPFSVSSSLWSDQRGMHDLGEFAKRDTLEEAVETAVEMAEDLTGDGEEETPTTATDGALDWKTAPREEVGWTVVGIHTDAGQGEREAPIALAMFPDANWGEVGDLVADRIEAASGEAWSAVERPEPGETRRCGLVAWDSDGRPTRFYTSEHAAVYNRQGIATITAIGPQ